MKKSLTMLFICLQIIICTNMCLADNVDNSPNLVKVIEKNNTECTKKMEEITKAVFNPLERMYVELGQYISIFNSDKNETILIYPLYYKNQCKYIFFVDKDNNVTLSQDIKMFEEIKNLKEYSSDYLLYLANGDYYAQNRKEKVKLIDDYLQVDSTKDTFNKCSYKKKIQKIKKEKKTVSQNYEETSEKTNSINFKDTVVSTITMPTIMGAVCKSQCKITNFVGQGNYGLCWAATVATIVNYKKPLSNLTAKKVANAMNIGYDEGATMSQSKKALKNYGLSYKLTGKLTWNQVKKNIGNDKPFVIRLYSSAGGHQITGYGFNCRVIDTDAPSRMVMAWDSNGSKICFLYDAKKITTSGYTFQWTNSLY